MLRIRVPGTAALITATTCPVSASPHSATTGARAAVPGEASTCASAVGTALIMLPRHGPDVSASRFGTISIQPPAVSGAKISNTETSKLSDVEARTLASSAAGNSADAQRTRQVTLRWQPTAKESHLQVSRDAQFSWLIFNTNTDKGEAHMPRPDFGTYYARVQGVNADGSSTPFSPAQAFIVTDHWVINDGGPANGKRDAGNNGASASGH